MAKKPVEEIEPEAENPFLDKHSDIYTPEAVDFAEGKRQREDEMLVTSYTEGNSVEIRYNCLQLAVANYGANVQPADMVQNAQVFYDFVKG